MRQFLWAFLCMSFFVVVLQAAPSFTNVAIDDAFVFPGALITAQIVEIRVPTGETLTLNTVTVKNTASNPVGGGDLEYIEIRRGSTTGPLLGKATSLAGFDGTGVQIQTTANNTFTSGTHKLYILVKLKHDENLVRKKLSLGDTELNSTRVSYPPAPATFTVVGPKVEFETLEGGSVYRGQRFLAARVTVDGSAVPLSFTISHAVVKNVASAPTLSGAYVARIEVRRAEDGALLGEQTSATELAKFATTGTLVPTTANNSVTAYSQLSLEIWVTLKTDAPLGHQIALGTALNSGIKLRCQDTDFTAGKPENAPTFFVRATDLGISAETVALVSRGVVPGQTFLAQRVRLVDNDEDPYDVVLGSVLVRNGAENPLAEQHVAKIEVKRRADGALLGSTTDLSGFNTTGVRISFAANNLISDDTTVELELYVTLRETAPLDRKIKLSTQIWYNEGGASLTTSSLDGPATFTVIGPQGLETINNTTTPPADRNVYPGQAFLAQKLYLEDKDDDPYSVTLTRVLIKNLSTGTVMEDRNVAKIEVRDAAGRLLGETTSISGLTTSGVWVNLTANNLVSDDKSLTIEIWVSLKSDVPSGKKFTAGARIEHSEGGQTFTKPETFRSSEVEFTTATDGARTVNFTYTPEKPKWSDEITFTPSVSPATGIVYARWDFGDGTIIERRTAAGEKPLDPIKYTYKKGGEFTVTYAVRDEANRETRATKKITVTNEPPKNVDFSFTPASPQVNQELTFTPAANIEDPDGDIKKATFRWNFGDGSPEVTTTGPRNVTKTYTQAGTYTVILTVTDEGGAMVKAQKDVRVGAPPPPAPQTPTVTGLTTDPANPEAGKPVTLTAATTAPANDPATSWEWDFGDGTPVQTTQANTATHTYANPGLYTVRVRARNNAGWSSYFSRQIIVFPPGVEFGALVLDNPVTGNQCRIQIFAPAGATNLRLTILDQAGRPILVDKPVSVGTFTWDLKDRDGRVVPNGLYLFYITAQIQNETKRTEIGRILVRR